MKKLLKTYFFLVSSVLLLGACSGYDNRNACLLSHIDSLLDVRPDSALRMLQSVSPDSLADRNERAYYGLLLVQAKYKNYLPLKDDTLSQALATYYGETGNRTMQARAYYNLGCVYTDKKEFDHAFRAYHEAARLARQENDKLTLCRTYNNLAHICLTQGMPERADSLYAAVETLARQTGDSIRLAEALLRRGGYALSLGESAHARARQLIEEGHRLAQTLHSPTLLHISYATLYTYHDHKGLHEQTKAVAKEYGNMAKDAASVCQSALLLGNSYYQLTQWDSAIVCLHRALETDNNIVKENAYALLSRIAERRGDQEQAIHWIKEKEHQQLQLQASQKEKEVAAAALEFELKEKWQANIQNRLYKYYIIIACLLLCIGVLGVFHWKKRKEKKAMVTDKTPPTCTEEIQPSPEIQPAWDYTEFKRRMKQTANYDVIISILKSYKKCAEYTRHWDIVEQQKFLQKVEDLLPGYQKALMKKYPDLSAKDISFCLLYMLDLSDEQVGVLIERDRSTVYRKRKNILLNKMRQDAFGIDNLLKSCML